MRAKLKTFSIGGIHPSQNKFTAGSRIEELELPRRVVLTLSQHIGAPAEPVVKPGDAVVRGDMIASASAFMSVPVHTPISGTVKRVSKSFDGTGRMVQSVVVEADEEQHLSDERQRCRPLPKIAEINDLSPRDIRDGAKHAGLVGLGGAAFPLHVKLSPPADATIDTVVVNGAECEPYLTCDDALMRVSASEILEGVRLAMRAVGATRAFVGIENNKPEAIESMSEAASEMADVEIVPLAMKYPQGGEKQLINALTGRVVPTGALPAAVGCVVINVATAFSLSDALLRGKPLMERIVTVTGPDFKGGNYRLAVGFEIEELLRMVVPARVLSRAGKIIAGGPMMGKALDNPGAPIRKATSGLLILSEELAGRPAAEPCVRCARCVEVCPMGLQPYLISTLSRLRQIEEAADSGVLNCIECGSCQWVCPSSRPLLDFIRSGKGAARMLVKK